MIYIIIPSNKNNNNKKKGGAGEFLIVCIVNLLQWYAHTIDRFNLAGTLVGRERDQIFLLQQLII
jgi:hypothetical protein